jgi:ABC-2 type transport system ATP-binding protein
LNTLLEVSHLSKKYGPLYAVKDLSFSIQKGMVYGLLGPNGSGKSTTLGMVLNVVNPTVGSFSWFQGQATTHQALKKVGAIIERPNFYPYLSAIKNLKLVSKIKEVSEDHIKEKLELVGLWDRRDSKFSTYSLGMKQRLAIASALLNNPEVLILDEPTNGLDPEGIHQIREIIKKIAGTGTTILLASHLLDEVEKVCTHVVVLRKGELIYNGEVAKMNNHLGFVKVNSDNHQVLITALKQMEELENIRIEATHVLADLKKELDPTELNKRLYNQGIYLSSLSKEKESLEQQFLNLTKKEQ